MKSGHAYAQMYVIFYINNSYIIVIYQFKKYSACCCNRVWPLNNVIILIVYTIGVPMIKIIFLYHVGTYNTENSKYWKRLMTEIQGVRVIDKQRHNITT